MRINTRNADNSGFVAGVITTLLVFTVCIGLFELGTWLASHPQPQAAMAWAAEPRYSLLDVLGTAGTLGVFGLVIWVLLQIPRYMPR